MRVNGYSGEYEDDLERFFRRSPWDVSDGEVWRWRAACQALRELTERPTDG
jgi:hypothetical protein